MRIRINIRLFSTKCVYYVKDIEVDLKWVLYFLTNYCWPSANLGKIFGLLSQTCVHVERKNSVELFFCAGRYYVEELSPDSNSQDSVH